jgi:predicted PurR-regulated permease PerM
MSLIAAVPTGILLAILHVPFAVSLAIIVGLFDLIPLVGATLGAIIVLIVCLFTSQLAAIVMLIYFLVFQQVENHVFQPFIFGKSVAISPLLVLVAVLFGAALGNILGALIAIPVVASLQILVKDYLPYWTNRKIS